MNRLTTKDRARILSVLCEGMGINAATRITGASKNTVLKLLAEVGEGCALHQDRVMTGLRMKKVQCDETWSFVGMKQHNMPDEFMGVFGPGDAYTWTAIDADTKLVPCWHVGTRDAESAYNFIHDLAKRLDGHMQLTTDGHSSYLVTAGEGFGADIDFTQLVKLYGNEGQTKEDARRSSPAECTGAERKMVAGNPVLADVPTSYVARQNLTMRLLTRHFPRLTNAYSRKLENHMHAISLYFMYYNFCKIHNTLLVPPAMEAGVTDHVWDLEEVIMMTETNV